MTVPSRTEYIDQAGRFFIVPYKSRMFNLVDAFAKDVETAYVAKGSFTFCKVTACNILTKEQSQ